MENYDLRHDLSAERNFGFMNTDKLRKQESERQIRIHKNRCGNLFDEASGDNDTSIV